MSMQITSSTANNTQQSVEIKKNFQEKKDAELIEALKKAETIENSKSQKTPEQIEGDQKIAMLKKQCEGIQHGKFMSGIDTKMRSGKRLSQNELEYLRTKSPDIYKKAVEIERRRKVYRQQLEHCRTREDAKKLKTRTLQGFFVKADGFIKSGSSMDNFDTLILSKAAMWDEHNKFITTHPLIKEKSACNNSIDENTNIYNNYGKRCNKSSKKHKLFIKI